MLWLIPAGIGAGLLLAESGGLTGALGIQKKSKLEEITGVSGNQIAIVAGLTLLGVAYVVANRK